jgi:pyruvate formate lyase activating enzyme
MEALLYETLDNLHVKCHLCHHRCTIKNGQRGICGVRENNDGILHTLSYGLTAAQSIDPIEKKPLYGYLPGTKTYSFATAGCNMNCRWCQNHQLSQQPKPQNTLIGSWIPPTKHIEYALYYQCPSISYTYSEPTIFLEYALETMKLAHQNNIKNIWVTNGFMTQEALELILPYLDAANVDYKTSVPYIYKEYTLGEPNAVLKNIRTLYEKGIHVEVTTLIVPGVNDRDEDIKQMAKDISSISTDIIWHISRFFPQYRMKHVKPTSIKTMEKAKAIGNQYGIKNIYLGNM